MTGRNDMNTNLIRKTIALTVSFGICAGVCACGKEAKETVADDTVNVTVYEAGKDDITSSVEYTGKIVSGEDAAVSAKVSGEAKTIAVKKGDYVRAGATLLTIDSTSYRLAYNQALAAYNSAVAGKKSAEANYNSVTGGSTQQSVNQLETALNSTKLAYDNALDNYNRQKTLYDMGAISEVEFNTYETSLENARLSYENAKTSYDLTKNVVIGETEHSAKASVESADAGIQQAKAALDIAANNLSNCTVTAPISGYVSAKNVTKGQVVSPGVSIFTIANPSSVEVEINVTESVISLIKEGGRAKVDVSGADVKDAEGTVASFNPVKNASTGLYSVKVSIPNENGKLKDGMIASITLVTEERSKVITIPTSAIMQSDDDGYYVYIANGDEAEKVLVEIGIENGEYTEIIAGVKTGDKVITDGKDYISENNKKIKIVEE